MPKTGERTPEEIRAKVVLMLEAAHMVVQSPAGGSYARGAAREMERLLAWIDGDDGA